MKAVVVSQKGTPDVLKLQEVPMPQAKEGWVVIEVKAFGINRSEMYTRQGHSPDVQFPRILGIECVGVVVEDPSGTYQKGQQIATIMGGMGRDFDGSYAEFTTVPIKNVFKFESDLPWSTLGAIPEMFQTVSGSLYDALDIQAGETLLIRGGTSSIGMTATQMAKILNVTVLATTRNEGKVEALKKNGVSHVILDNGEIAEQVREIYPNGVDKVLELVGTTTLLDSLKCAKRKGIVCMTGILGNSWTISDFEPMGNIPSTVRLTSYGGDVDDLSSDLLQDFIDDVEVGKINLNIDRVFKLEEIVEVHKYMENSQAKGKLVVSLV